MNYFVRYFSFPKCLAKGENPSENSFMKSVQLLMFFSFFQCSLGSMADLGIKAGDNVLLVWAQPSKPATLKQYAEELCAIVGTDGKVSVENAERLLLCESGFAYSPFLSHS